MSAFAPVFLVNGRPGATLSPLDRGFAYGDGVFETLILDGGTLPLWDYHQQRLLAGCECLGIPLPLSTLTAHKDQLLALAARHAVDTGVAKLVVTRGEGGRGYATPAEPTPTIVAGLYPPPAYPVSHCRTGVQVRVCNQRLGTNPALAGLKHLNRLENVLARREWTDTAIAEGLLLDQNGQVIEATASNVFIVKDAALITPRLDQCGVAGVARRIIMEVLVARLTPPVSPVQEARLSLEMLRDADEIFLCNSVNGIWPVLAVEQWHYPRGPVTAALQQCFETYLDERRALS
ncbi:aminodeoxychorismate lyase [Exilibacterium tricleocarpae]|uniref:Aminodeoxychorismate lyase n=1 Tax=Exilibacterium tricleocarpae TaxID=2591008 RepID=A0A545T8F8_9GAMM|nr:aminodeoxychorismate lyase [Exilibacterium tricleocarpae]TQV73489.1 aminodeoxychorismate lyase [Exilibacterium tricleocarpae]